MNSQTRSPIKRSPLRTPGQSVQSRLQDVLLDGVLAPWLVALLLAVVALLEGVRAWFNSPPTPWLMGFMAFAAVAYAVWRTRKALKVAASLRLARDGEVAIGQYLEDLRRSGFSVFHDVQGENFNIDHAIVGPKGVFSIETKTWRKPRSPDATITFDGEELRAAGFLPSRDPIIQGKAQASWLASLLEELTGRKVAVRPVVLFPGWYVEQAKGSFKEIWVLNPKALPTFLGNEPDRHAPDEVAMLASHLSRHIRAEESRRI